MASSTTMPIANTIANSVDRLIVKPSAAMAANAPMMVTGTVVMGTSMARQSCRNTTITISTRIAASNSVFHTSLMDSRTNVVVSKGSVVAEPRRKFFRGLFLFFGDWPRHVERVRLQRLKNADARRGLAVEREHLAVGLRTQLDPADVTHIDHLPVRF